MFFYLLNIGIYYNINEATKTMDSSLEIQDLSTVSTENITIRCKNRRDVTKVSKPEI